MKRHIFPIVFIFCLLVSFFSCSNKSNKRPRKPVSTIVISPAKQMYNCGDIVTLEVKTRLRDGELKSVKVYYEGELLKESDELKFEIPNVELKHVGNISFQINAEKTDGLKNSRTKTINVLSDITPKQMTYQVNVKYPHLKTSYTQGLEYYNGYLYEGTGETGHSKLMKINIRSGEPVQSFDMDDKYFGEGITLLNDKIYQLTWKAQKGFIYDLETFAVIDSFTYKSEQGWGLTNDGTNLIMSDGTNVLTWLNPEDFSVVKTLQVADNTGNLVSLNELELVDDVIYANIYTTNLIVKIDIETGKVIEHIKMDGLIDMYHRPNDRIDVLNGIAYDAENDRMFITGKLWPMLFEVKFIEQ
ncbi:MAG TPA: glutaminyl-peptide cyclotransferase [Draconibacterium sp.]|nr:glutaminyl-peptide cyclotransferase [Draconibacterium sp.]